MLILYLTQHLYPHVIYITNFLLLPRTLAMLSFILSPSPLPSLSHTPRDHYVIFHSLPISPSLSVSHPSRSRPSLLYPSPPTLHNLFQIVCSIHSMDIHMGDAWCRAPFDISCNKVQAVVKSVSGEYQVCWEMLLPVPTTKGRTTY